MYRPQLQVRFFCGEVLGQGRGRTPAIRSADFRARFLVEEAADIALVQVEGGQDA